MKPLVSRGIAPSAGWAGVLALLAASAASAAAPPCRPCGGVEVADPRPLVDQLNAAPRLAAEERLYVAWPAELDGSADSTLGKDLTAAGATPWTRLIFRVAAPLTDNTAELDRQLAEAAALARDSTGRPHFQIDWRPPQGEPWTYRASEYAFLLKRASVAIQGAQPEARVLTGPLGTDPGWIRRLYAEDVAAYVEGIVLDAGPDVDPAGLLDLLAELDPGRPVTLTGTPFPARPLDSLAAAARHAADGFAVTLFAAAGTPDVGPLKLLAREFQGDLALDPYSAPVSKDGAEGWAFVRGRDLGLRVIVERGAETNELMLAFSGTGLQRPARVDTANGEASDLYGLKTRDGLEVSLLDPAPVELLRLERLSASEIEGIQGLEEEVLVTGERQLPVEEILRRLQAFEDGQARRLRHYRAVNTTHLRYQAGTGGQAIETTFRGGFFFRQGAGFDWAWDDFLINGVRWRSKRIPEIPIIQPEKAAAAPVEISFTREYRYSLRGTDTVGGRDCWVVDFRPAVAVEEGRSLYRGTVWVDREIYARVKTRAIQLGLTGEVLSSDETTFFSPVDASGATAEWSAQSYFLPLRLVGQQVWSILSASLVVEREVVLTDVAVNSTDFADRRQAALDSEVTMIRDTDEGMRYIVADPDTGDRVVREEISGPRRFLAGGLLYDESQDYPLPLAGINWLWFDWRGTGVQADVFFAGPLTVVSVADPSFRGSKWDFGFDAFVLAVPGTDTIFRDGVERNEEDVETISPSIDLNLGRPLGSFGKLEIQYELGYAGFDADDDTAPDFVVPTDTLEHTLRVTGRYHRSGYRVRGWASQTQRDKWEPWGRPGGLDFDPEDDEFSKWGLGLGKTFHLPKFFKFGVELEYVDGSQLDRFSKYGLGPFGAISVQGYQSDKVRAEEAMAARLSYGFGLGDAFRVDLVGDAAWLTDLEAGFEDELAAGVGVAGTFLGPWSTIIRANVGTALAGPDSGVNAFITVLKLLEPGRGGKRARRARGDG